jgi:hypothetical protein
VAVLCLQGGLEELSLLHGQSMLTDSDLLEAAERSRRVLSTVDNLIATNAERAYKAAAVYTKAKIVKEDYCEQSMHPKRSLYFYLICIRGQGP